MLIGGVFGLALLVVVGALVGWLASLIVKGGGTGFRDNFWGNVLIGIGGSLLGGWLLPMIGINFSGLVGHLIGAVAGAVILIFIIRKIRTATN